jgi:stage II sporulation protein D
VETGGKRVVFHGRGLGHGVGMCQYGALGMAKAGKDYRVILEHYYPGTELKQWP